MFQLTHHANFLFPGTFFQKIAIYLSRQARITDPARAGLDNIFSEICVTAQIL